MAINNDWEQLQAAVDNVNYLFGRMKNQYFRGNRQTGAARGMGGGTSGRHTTGTVRRRQPRRRQGRSNVGGQAINQ